MKSLKKWWIKFLRWLAKEELQRPPLDEVIPIPLPRRVMIMLGDEFRLRFEFLSHPTLWPDGTNAVCRPIRADDYGRSQFVWVKNVRLACEFQDETTALVFVNTLFPDLKDRISIVPVPVKSNLEKVNGNNS
jgi:hypothetical protein